MKILYLVHQFFPDDYTGTEKFLLNLAKSMQRFGHRVTVLTYERRQRRPFDETVGGLNVRRYTFQGLPVVALQYVTPPSDLEQSFINPILAEFARQFLAEEQPDLLHVAHSMRMGEIVRVAQAQGLPYLLTLTDFFLLCPKCNLMASNNSLCAGPELGNTCRRCCPELPEQMVANHLAIAESILRQAKRLIAPSKFLGGMFKQQWNDLDIELNGYGISFGKIKRNARQYAPGAALTFFYGGSFIYHKGVHILIDAFRKLEGAATLKIYGSGHLRETLQKLAAGDPRIQFCGVFAPEQLNDVLREVDVTVVPSIWYENTPIMMLESLAAEVPVIVTDLGGMTECITHGVNGYVFPIGDSARLKDVLQELVAHPNMLNQVKANIRRQGMHTVEQEALAYEREYRQILRQRALTA